MIGKWSVGTGWSLGAVTRGVYQRLTLAAARATDKAAEGARDDIRRAMRGQRLGGLANVISFTSDLKKGRREGRGGSRGFDVAGFVTLKGIKSERTAGALKSYIDNENTTISPVRGRWLAIATPELPKKAGGRKGRKMTPEIYRREGLEDKIGPLTFIPGKHAGVAYLVVKDATISLAKQGKARKASKGGYGGKSRARVGFVAFVLIRQTRRSIRVNPVEIARKWQAKLPRLLADEMTRAPSQARTPIGPRISGSAKL